MNAEMLVEQLKISIEKMKKNKENSGHKHYFPVNSMARQNKTYSDLEMAQIHIVTFFLFFLM